MRAALGDVAYAAQAAKLAQPMRHIDHIRLLSLVQFQAAIFPTAFLAAFPARRGGRRHAWLLSLCMTRRQVRGGGRFRAPPFLFRLFALARFRLGFALRGVGFAYRRVVFGVIFEVARLA
jgi:hypothetical protein